MYLREFKEPPEHIVTKGKAQFGTYKGVPKEIDIRGLRAPYANIPLPPFITNLRIKSNLTYFFNLDKYIGVTIFSDFKICGLASIVLWNKETGKKNAYNVLMPVRRRFVPKKTNLGSCTSFRKARHIRISWGRNHEHHSLSFKVKGDSVRPDATGFIYSSIQDAMHSDFLFVNPSPVKSRCKATWVTPMQIHGLVKVGDTPSDDSNGLGAMVLTRSYYKERTRSIILCGLGKIGEKNLVFELSSSTLDAADSNTYNDNILIKDGEATALPPVDMTHPFGKDKQWIIQDTESMIDLTFTPISIHSRQVSVLPMREAFKMIYGTFTGVLLNKNGEKINLKNFPGILYDNLLRL